MIIDKPLITLNEYIKLERANKFAAASVKKSETLYCEICARNQMKPVTDYPVDVLIKWYTTERKDHDNISFGFKFAADGMVNAGILKNDSPKYIRNISHEFFKDKNEHCVIELITV